MSVGDEPLIIRGRSRDLDRIRPLTLTRSTATVVLTIASTGPDDHIVRNLAEQIVRKAPDALVVVLEPGATLEALDEDQMRAAGWVRADAAHEAVDRDHLTWQPWSVVDASDDAGFQVLDGKPADLSAYVRLGVDPPWKTIGDFIEPPAGEPGAPA